MTPHPFDKFYLDNLKKVVNNRKVYKSRGQDYIIGLIFHPLISILEQCDWETFINSNLYNRQNFINKRLIEEEYNNEHNFKEQTISIKDFNEKLKEFKQRKKNQEEIVVEPETDSESDDDDEPPEITIIEKRREEFKFVLNVKVNVIFKDEIKGKDFKKCFKLMKEEIKSLADDADEIDYDDFSSRENYDDFTFKYELGEENEKEAGIGLARNRKLLKEFNKYKLYKFKFIEKVVINFRY